MMGWSPSFDCLLLVAMAQEELGREVMQMFDKMRDRYTPILCSYMGLLLVWCNAKNLVEAGCTSNETLNKGVGPDVVRHNTI
jgi:hypothetical protein